MRSLRIRWPVIRRRVLNARHVMLCCDFDGTLAPIVEHPSRARLPAGTKRLLRRLVGLPGLWVALVSGRALHDLKRMVGIRGLYYIGNHGLELEGPDFCYVNPVARASRLLLKNISGELKVALRSIPGAWVERKDLSFSIHWRNVPKTAHRTFHRVVAQCTDPYLGQRAIQRTTGKRVIEIRPSVKWDKGTIITWLLSRLREHHEHSKPLVLYFGDDQTDEAAFRATNRLWGLSVFVGPRRHPTAARYRLNNPREVHRWLAELLRLR